MSLFLKTYFFQGVVINIAKKVIKKIAFGMTPFLQSKIKFFRFNLQSHQKKDQNISEEKRINR
jgi:hypothetical protein